MARYKPVNYSQDKFIPVSYDKQIQAGTFEHTLCYMVDCEFDLSVFDSQYNNDETGAPAFNPAVLLKIVLFAYYRHITSSREIERLCRENVIFMALSADTQPHFTTIASFVSGMGEQIVPLFRNVLMVCDEVGIVQGDMIAVDGCKLSSNASKEWSGTKEELASKKQNYEKAARSLLDKHRQSDTALEDTQKEREIKAIDNLQRKAKKIKDWLDDNDDKPGQGGKPVKSNVTDNDSATMRTSKGVIQGFCAVGAADSSHQVLTYVEAFGQGPENNLLAPVLEGVEENFAALGDRNRLQSVKVSADSGFYSRDSLAYVNKEGIDAYLVDGQFRKRDPGFFNVEKYKTRSRKEKQQRQGNKPRVEYTNDHFIHDKKRNKAICPAGKTLYSGGTVVDRHGIETYRFKGTKKSCQPCTHRSRCLQNPDKTVLRQVSIYKGRVQTEARQQIDQMKTKVDSTTGRHEYSRRMGIVEPVFGNITSTLKLSRFSLRGKEKVNIQWNLYAMVHNLLKIHRYGQWGEAPA